MTSTFTIQAVDDGGTLMWAAPRGLKSVVLFTSREAADSFVGCQCSAIQLRTVELTPETIELWFQRVRRAGARYAIVDPSMDSDQFQSNHADLEDLVQTILRRREMV